MIFTKRLRDGVRRGDITCSVRIWQRPHVIAGNRYRMEEGEIEVDSVLPISFADITPELARESGFMGVVDLLKVAKHGSAAWLPEWTCRLMPAPVNGMGAGTASQLIPGVRLLVALSNEADATRAWRRRACRSHRTGCAASSLRCLTDYRPKSES